MKIQQILFDIESGEIALPTFQRGYVWNRDQVRALFASLYARHPVGTLLIWKTASDAAETRGDAPTPVGTVRLLLDGQQRMTSVFGVAYGTPPLFFDATGKANAFENLYFNCNTQTFQFFQPNLMKDDPLWVDVTRLLRGGNDAAESLMAEMIDAEINAGDAVRYGQRLNHLLGILDIDIHVDEISGHEKTMEVVVDIFNRVNSGGTKLSRADLALAKICAMWPEAREAMNGHLREWQRWSYDFDLTWLLRTVNVVATGEAQFEHLHNVSKEEFVEALGRTKKFTDSALTLIAARLGLDQSRVLRAAYAVPLVVRYLDRRADHLSAAERDSLMYWFAQAAIWGRYAGPSETTLNEDLETLDAALDEGRSPTADLIASLRLARGDLQLRAEHYGGATKRARFYSVLYMLTRMSDARDWGSGLRIADHKLGPMDNDELHHIFPKAQLRKAGYRTDQINALANFCFLTAQTNRKIGSRRPEEYFPEIQRAHPGALESQWIPMDEDLWRIENYEAFLAARRSLLAASTNALLDRLADGDASWSVPQQITARAGSDPVDSGSPEEEEEDEVVLRDLNSWTTALGLQAGQIGYDLGDVASDDQAIVLDLAWPDGVQEGQSAPVAVLLDGPTESVIVANRVGFRCFTDVGAFKRYVEEEILEPEF